MIDDKCMICDKRLKDVEHYSSVCLDCIHQWHKARKIKIVDKWMVLSAIAGGIVGSLLFHFVIKPLLG